MMTRATSVVVAGAFLVVVLVGIAPCPAASVIIDHTRIDLTQLSLDAVEKAKAELHIAYEHTSHGSQIVDGMTGLNPFINGGGLGMSCPTDTFKWNDGPMAGALDMDDNFASGDLGSPNRTAWADETRDYLDDPAHDDVNVVMWSWCGQADTTEENIDLYLGLMTQLESEYADVKFVYMTGHTNGCSTTGNLFLRNQQIRDYCIANNKILYDFADIESWDLGGNYYGDKLVNDECYYDSNGDGTRDSNWARAWQDDTVNHAEGVDWYDCPCAHSEPLNGNQKAYAAWALWAALGATIDAVPGDATCDGVVDEADAAVLAEHWGQSGMLWIDGDFNDDGTVDMLDASILAANWSPTEGEAASVPEPGAAVWLVGLVLLCVGRNRRA